MKPSAKPKIKDIEKKAQYISKILNESVAEALEKKRKLGQYAVVWDGEKVVRILPTDTISTPSSHPKQKPQT